MTTDLYLIAHKCRGEAAFDVAVQMDCPECAKAGCPECDSLGYWWIIPTSGHRAYPWDYVLLSSRIDLSSNTWGAMPADLPDHYTVNASPKAHKRNLLAELGLAQSTTHPTMTGTLKRRI